MITLMWLDILLVIMLVKTKVKTTRINVEGWKDLFSWTYLIAFRHPLCIGLTTYMEYIHYQPLKDVSIRIETSPYSQLRKSNKVKTTPSSQRKTSKQGPLKQRRNNIKGMN
jgi:hypothetical protein